MMDNATFHKKHNIQQVIIDAGYMVEYLPTYSPDLNPIEHKWAQAKSKKQKKRDGLRYREFVLSPYGVIKIKSLGYNGPEFALHEQITQITGAQVYFAHPYHSWERGLNEHTNGLIRRFYPKGTDFSQVSHRKIAELEHILNTRRRKSLGYRSPNEVFLTHLLVA